jgi:hypothetical protein
VRRKIKFTLTADGQYSDLENTLSKAGTFEQVRKAIGYLEIDPHHPSLNAHEFTSLAGANGEKIFEAYAQNKNPGAYRIFWHYGPDETKGKKRIPVITIVAITPIPSSVKASSSDSNSYRRRSSVLLPPQPGQCS